MSTRLNELELTSLHRNLCEGIVMFHEQVKDGRRARLLFYAMAAYLDELGIIDQLKDAANYVAENRALWDADAGPIIQ